MDRNLRWRSFGLVFLIGACLCVLAPSAVSKDKLPSWFRSVFSKINLGLDLQGGLHILYSIDLDKAVDDKASEIKRDLDAKFSEGDLKGQIAITTPAQPLGSVTIKLKDAKRHDEVEKAVMADYKDVVASRDCAAADGAGAICVQVSTKYSDGIKTAALHSAVITIRDRIDERGIAEPSVVEKGDDIIVELPGLGSNADASDPKASAADREDDPITRVRSLIARTAKLEFKLVDDESPYMTKVYNKVKEDPEAKAAEIVPEIDSLHNEESNTTRSVYFLTAHDRVEQVTVAWAKAHDCWKSADDVVDGKVSCNVSGRAVIERYLYGDKVDGIAGLDQDPSFKLPDGGQMGYELKTPETGTKDAKAYWRTYFLDRTVRLSGSAVTQATVGSDPNTYRPVVYVDFNRAGGHAFGDLTAENVGKQMAIILDDKVMSAPTINTAIRGGRAIITMGGADPVRTQHEAEDLVSTLKTGSLPAPLKEESHASIGPTLGRDAVEKAKLSFGIGVLLVFVIMIGIYKWSGWVSIGAVTINVLMMMTAMALFGATLTLPGIAALVLTVGMGVDGNILIYERIRDELNLGKSVRGAVDVGFSRAFTAILDGHMTTACGGWVLLQYGSGPIKGFAVMLLVGIGTTLFTNTVVTRIFFDWYLSRKKFAGATISI